MLNGWVEVRGRFKGWVEVKADIKVGGRHKGMGRYKGRIEVKFGLGWGMV